MEQNPSSEASRFSASQEIPLILWNPKVHYCIYKSLPPVPYNGDDDDGDNKNKNNTNKLQVTSATVLGGLKSPIPMGYNVISSTYGFFLIHKHTPLAYSTSRCLKHDLFPQKGPINCNIPYMPVHLIHGELTPKRWYTSEPLQFHK
jgi:hypothetical protein